MSLEVCICIYSGAWTPLNTTGAQICINVPINVELSLASCQKLSRHVQRCLDRHLNTSIHVQSP